jgi:hypothetical protein
MQGFSAGKTTEPKKLQLPIHPLWIILIAAVGIAAMVAIRVKMRKPPPPDLTRNELNAAMAQWEKGGLRSYDLDFVFTTGYLGDTHYHLEVRDGEVTKLLRDGHENLESSPEYWTIDHQFSVIAEDVEKLEKGQFKTVPGVTVHLYAEFDPEYGFTKSYRKEARGNPENFQWHVERFTPLP